MSAVVVKDCLLLFDLILIIVYFFLNVAEIISHIKASRAFYKRVNDFENTSLDDIAKAYINLNK